MSHESDEPHVELYWGDYSSCSKEFNKLLEGRVYCWTHRGLQGYDGQETILAINAEGMKAETLRLLCAKGHCWKRVLLTTQQSPAKLAHNAYMLETLLNASRFCMTLPDFEEVPLQELRKPVPAKGARRARVPRQRLPPPPPKLKRQTAQDATSRKRLRADSESEEPSFYESLCREAEEQEGKRKREEESQRSDTHLECPEHTQA